MPVSDYPVVVLAGGLATRLRPYTETIPKALIEIAGEPFVAHQLRLLASHGIREVVFCTGYLGNMIQDFVGDGSAFHLRVRFSEDGPRLLGTGGAVKRALPLLGDAFFVLYGDSYLECDYDSVASAFAGSGKDGLMTVFANEGQYDTSNVEFDGRSILAYDKHNRTSRMRHIDYGLGLLRKSAFDVVPEGEVYDLAALYQHLLAAGQLAAFEVTRRFYEIGSHAGIRELNEYIQRQTTAGHRRSSL